MPKCNWRRHCAVNNISLFLTFLGIISSAVTIIVFARKLTDLSEYDYLYDYKASICEPITGRAFNLSCRQTSRWIAVLVLKRGLQAIDNPFAIRNSRVEAVADRDKIEMFSNFSCVCRQVHNQTVIKGCSWWPDCILNADFIYYMQRDNDRYYQTYISFIVASVVSLVLSIIGVPFSIVVIRRSSTNQYIPLE